MGGWGWEDELKNKTNLSQNLGWGWSWGWAWQNGFSTVVDIFLMPFWFFPQVTQQPWIDNLTQAWLMNVYYIRIASETFKGSFNHTPYSKLLQVNTKITSETTWRITSSQGNLVLLSLAVLYLSLVLFYFLVDFLIHVSSPFIMSGSKHTKKKWNYRDVSELYFCHLLST